MKFNKFFASIAAAVATLASCTVEGPTYLDEVKVDCSYITLPEEGGSKTVKLTATTDWQFEETPEWLTVAPASGAAGEFDVKFTATALSEHQSEQEANFNILANGKKVGIRVIQGIPVSIANTKETAYTADKAIELYLAGKDLGAEIFVKGVVTRASIDLSYGNAEFYLEENSEDYSFEFYRCLDFNGAKFTDDKKVKVGDTIIAKGTLTKYNSTIELAQGCILVDIVKADLDLTNAEDLTIGKEGGEVTALFTVNGGNFNFNVLDDFLAVKEVKPGTEGATAVVISVLPNDGGAREGQIEFTSGKAKLVATISQEGAIAEVSVEEFLAEEVGTALYKLSGFITDRTDISGHKFDLVNYGNFDLTDATGNVYVYGVGAKGDIATYGVKEGDIITITGTRADYKGTPQVGGGQYVSHKSVTPVTAAEAATLADDDKTNPANYIRLTGKVTKPSAESGNKFDIETYGNFDLVDESGSIYVYGVTTGWNGESKKFGTLGVKEGDIITIVAYKTSYKGNAQVVGMYVSHESGALNYPSAQTSWRYDIPGDSDGGFMLLTFIDDTNCYMASGDKEGIWWDPADGFSVGTYAYDPVENLGAAFSIYSLQMLPDGTLSVYGGAFIMHQVTYIPIPEN